MTLKKQRQRRARELRAALRNAGVSVSLPLSLRLVRRGAFAVESEGGLPPSLSVEPRGCGCGLRGCETYVLVARGQSVACPM